MYVVTFYSFKGGVGRTMALANTAYELAQKGRRVLIVDFDLEAPGISTYANFCAAAQRPGIVDYVTNYIQTKTAPNVKEYITECVYKTVKLWVMPAGKRNAEYAARLHSIDWQELYTEHQGYLMFEDLKQQLQELKDPKLDYVLIDSRTGHTDVGGICTRQLPNAVALLFLPNEENIAGLEQVVREIREDAKDRKRDVKILFCPSNVPDLDDEEEILKRLLKKAQKALGYSQAASIIHHYNSLALLSQEVFTLERPKTRLAEQYRALVAAIKKTNIEDREGALARLEELSEQIQEHRATDERPMLSDLREQVDSIRQKHKDDGRIAWALAAIFNSLGAQQKEYDALTVAIDQNYRSTEARYRRAQSQIALGEAEKATADLRAIVASKDAQPVELGAAVEMLRSRDPDWFSAVRAAPALSRYEAEDRLQILEYLTTERDVLHEVIDAAYEVQSTERTLHPAFESLLTLSLIGAGRFEEAMHQLSSSRGQILVSESIPDVFNYAMAEWGLKKTPPLDLLTRVLELDDADFNPGRFSNYSMCLALASAAIGNAERALLALKRATHTLGPGYLFSPWRYLLVSRIEFSKDILAIEDFVRKGRLLQPPFVNAHSKSTYAPRLQ